MDTYGVQWKVTPNVLNIQLEFVDLCRYKMVLSTI